MASAFIKSLPNEIKFWFAKASIGMMIADKKINEDEKFYLEGNIMFLGNKEQVKQIVEIARTKSFPKLQTIKTSRKVAAKIFIELAELAVTDSVITSSEAKYFTYIGRNLELNTIFSRKVLDWARRYAVVESDRKTLMTLAEAE